MFTNSTETRGGMFFSAYLIQDDDAGTLQSEPNRQLSKAAISGHEYTLGGNCSCKNRAVAGVGWPRPNAVDIVPGGRELIRNCRRQTAID